MRLMNEVNIADLVSKLAWKMAIKHDCLWVRLLRSKYLQGQDLRNTRFVPNQSWVWISIMKSSPFCRSVLVS